MKQNCYIEGGGHRASGARFKTLCLMLALCVGASTVANAGSYKVTYSGGTATWANPFAMGPSATTPSSIPYTLSDDGFYGGGGYASWHGGMTAAETTSGSVKCEGDITTTFTWQPTGNSTDDPPPDKVVIAEQGNTSMSSYSDSQSTGTANNNLGFVFVQDPNVSNSASGKSNGSLYQIKDNPGAGFTIKRSPKANLAGTGPVGVPVSLSGSASVSYTATALPLEVVLSGGIGPRDNKRFLVGQLVSATVSAGGLSVSANGFNWTVSGGEPFKNWTASSTQAVFTTLGTETGNSTAFYFRKAGVTGQAFCSLHLITPLGSLGSWSECVSAV